MQIRHVKVENFRGIKKLDWHIPSNLVCIIGGGDSCKTTLLDAIELALSSSPSVAIDDSDFFNMDVTQKVTIQVTLGGLGESLELERLLLAESNYGLYIRGYRDGLIIDEPEDGAEKVLTVEFIVDEELEPQWRVIAPGRHDPKPIRKFHLEKLGTAKLGSYADWHFSWSKNSMISRLLGKDVREINRALAAVGRKARSESLDLEVFQEQATSLKELVEEFGVKAGEYTPRLDIQALTVKSGGLSLHDDGVPIKRHGTGTKRLIALAIQKKLHEGKNIKLIDEIEYGLEPYRITQAMNKIHSSAGQTFITTHSPVVIREALVDNITSFHSTNGEVVATSLAVGLSDESKNALQGTLRTHAESFLSNKIIVCEGATEIGLSRALDGYRQSKKTKKAFAALGVATLSANGYTECAPIAERLKIAGYDVAIFCDSDKELTKTDDELNAQGIAVMRWSEKRCTEEAIFADLSEELLVILMAQAYKNKSEVDVRSMIISRGVQDLDEKPVNWPWSDAEFRAKVGKAASLGSWFKSITYGQVLGGLMFDSIDSEDQSKNFCTVIANLSQWCDK